MKRDSIFEKYIDGVTAFESGLVSSSQYILEDTLSLANEYHSETGNYHFCHIGILENLAKIYIHCKIEEKALLTLNIAKELEPDNLRILYRLFMFHLDTLPNEKLALQIYIEATNIYKKKGIYDINNELFKNFSIKGENIKKKRETDLIVDQNLKNERIEPQNLMKQLPIEILAEIFKRIDNTSLKNLLMVCKHWRSIILSSPLIIGIFRFKNDLTYNSLESYLRLFDKRILISEITVDQLSIDAQKTSQEFKIFKLLLASRLKTKTLNYSISNDFQHQLTKMIKESKSDLFNNLQKLNLNISVNYSAFAVLPSFLRFTTNLKILKITINSCKTNVNFFNFFRNSITLKKLQEIEIYSVNSDFISKPKLLQYLKTPNLKKATITAVKFSLIKHFLICSNGINHLKIINYPILDFIHDIDENIAELKNKLNSIERLEFINNYPSHKNHIVTQDMITKEVFKNLKSLSFEMTSLTNEELNYFIDCAKDTLEDLYILGKTHLDYGTINNRNLRIIFSLRYILENVPNIKRIRLNDSKITNSFFGFLLSEITDMKKPCHLEYLEIHCINMSTEMYLILLISIKEKLFIDHLKLYGKLEKSLYLLIKSPINKTIFRRVEFFT